MAAARSTKQQTDENAQTQTPAPLPAPGIGPLAGYPVPAGATHWRVHEIGADGRIREALSLSLDSDGQPVTRYPITSLGDAAWWDGLKTGQQVRVVFTRYHGDQLKARLGQGPVLMIPSGGERVAPPAPPAPPPPPPGAGTPGGDLFLVLRTLQREERELAEAAAQRHLNALEKMLLAQSQAQQQFYDSMTRMFLGERSEQRRNAAEEREAARREEAAERAARAKEREAERQHQARMVDGMRSVVREELKALEADEEEETAEEQAGDAIANAVTAIGDAAKPLISELTKRATKAAE